MALTEKNTRYGSPQALFPSALIDADASSEPSWAYPFPQYHHQYHDTRKLRKKKRLDVCVFQRDIHAFQAVFIETFEEAFKDLSREEKIKLSNLLWECLEDPECLESTEFVDPNHDASRFSQLFSRLFNGLQVSPPVFLGFIDNLLVRSGMVGESSEKHPRLNGGQVVNLIFFIPLTHPTYHAHQVHFARKALHTSAVANVSFGDIWRSSNQGHRWEIFKTWVASKFFVTEDHRELFDRENLINLMLLDPSSVDTTMHLKAHQERIFGKNVEVTRGMLEAFKKLFPKKLKTFDLSVSRQLIDYFRARAFFLNRHFSFIENDFFKQAIPFDHVLNDLSFEQKEGLIKILSAQLELRYFEDPERFLMIEALHKLQGRLLDEKNFEEEKQLAVVINCFSEKLQEIKYLLQHSSSNPNVLMLKNKLLELHLLQAFNCSHVAAQDRMKKIAAQAITQEELARIAVLVKNTDNLFKDEGARVRGFAMLDQVLGGLMALVSPKEGMRKSEEESPRPKLLPPVANDWQFTLEINLDFEANRLISRAETALSDEESLVGLRAAIEDLEQQREKVADTIDPQALEVFDHLMYRLNLKLKSIILAFFEGELREAVLKIGTSEELSEEEVKILDEKFCDLLVRPGLLENTSQRERMRVALLQLIRCVEMNALMKHVSHILETSSTKSYSSLKTQLADLWAQYDELIHASELVGDARVEEALEKKRVALMETFMQLEVRAKNLARKLGDISFGENPHALVPHIGASSRRPHGHGLLQGILYVGAGSTSPPRPL